MDGNGSLDIVTGNFGQQNVVYLNNGGGIFTQIRPFGIGADNTTSIAIGDVNDDGALDIVTGNSGQQNVVYLNDGSGNFYIGTVNCITSLANVTCFGTGTDDTRSVTLGDIDSDGDLDIITGNDRKQNIIYLNDGIARFNQTRNFGTGSDRTWSLAVGDINGDRYLDIVTGNAGQPKCSLSE